MILLRLVKDDGVGRKGVRIRRAKRMRERMSAGQRALFRTLGTILHRHNTNSTT